MKKNTFHKILQIICDFGTIDFEKDFPLSFETEDHRHVNIVIIRNAPTRFISFRIDNGDTITGKLSDVDDQIASALLHALATLFASGYNPLRATLLTIDLLRNTSPYTGGIPPPILCMNLSCKNKDIMAMPLDDNGIDERSVLLIKDASVKNTLYMSFLITQQASFLQVYNTINLITSL